MKRQDPQSLLVGTLLTKMPSFPRATTLPALTAGCSSTGCSPLADVTRGSPTHVHHTVHQLRHGYMLTGYTDPYRCNSI